MMGPSKKLDPWSQPGLPLTAFQSALPGVQAEIESTRGELEYVPAPPSVEPPRLPSKLTVLGMELDVVTGADVLDALAVAESTPIHLAYVNAHSLNLTRTFPEFRDALSGCSLILNDGIGLQLAARMRHASFPENLNGSDFTVRILALAADLDWRVFMYGSAPGVAEAASEALTAKLPHLRVVGTQHGYSSSTDAEVVRQIRESRADLLLVALGQPRQELWLAEHLAQTGCRLGVGVGAFLDFASGTSKRAPAWTNRLGVEWVVRLVREPRRLWRRYILGNPVFLYRAFQSRRRERSAPREASQA